MKIIAGALKGKLLSYPKNRLRPTTDKIRGAVFNMVEANFPGLINKALVCDIFAGAGAVGIESISRGATKVTFIENDKITLKYLKKNLKEIEHKSYILPIDARRAIDKIKTEKYDMIFLDPPYNMGLIAPIVDKLGKYNLLSKEGIIIIEHHKKEIFSIPNSMILYKRKDYSDTVISILKCKGD